MSFDRFIIHYTFHLFIHLFILQNEEAHHQAPERLKKRILAQDYVNIEEFLLPLGPKFHT